MTLYYSVSGALPKVKKILGNANHQIITALIGLSAIEDGRITDKPKNFPAKWEPKDPVASAARTRTLILEMALVRCVDALDVYIRLSIRQPTLMQSEELQRNISACSHSIFKKIGAIDEFVKCEDSLMMSLIWLIIVWRNRRVHTFADDDLCSDCRNAILGSADLASGRYSGLDVAEMLARYDKNKGPRFKEVASLIKVTQDYMYFLQRECCRRLNKDQYLKELVWFGLSERCEEFRGRQEAREVYAKRVWGMKGCKKRTAVKQFLKRNGLSSDVPKDAELCVVFDVGMIEKIGEMSPKEVLDWAGPDSMKCSSSR